MRFPTADPVFRKLAWTAAALAVTLAVAITVEVRSWRPAEVVVTTGKADVGGPFALTDHTGRAFTERDLVGRPHVIYFGWRLDPDLTPAALQVLSAALARLQPKSELPEVIFVSVDGARDATMELSEFIRRFEGGWRALRGTEEEIAALARAYKLYFKRLPDATLPGGYSIDHASLYYVMGKDGQFQGAIPHTANVAELAAALEATLAGRGK